MEDSWLREVGIRQGAAKQPQMWMYLAAAVALLLAFNLIVMMVFASGGKRRSDGDDE
jgi:hypothetical protein